MTDKQIIINDYFNIMRDENSRIFGIQEIGDIRQLIKDIIEQNEYIQAKEQELQEAMDNYVQLDLQRVKEYNELVDLYKAKKQECEELKKIINEAKNSKLDLKSFLVGEAVQNEYEQQLDQLKQILAKIKEICNNNDELQCDFNLVDCDKYKLGNHNLANKILHKLSECEVEDET